MDVIASLERLHQLAAESGDRSRARRAAEELTKLKQGRFHFVVVGQFKRGKTTLINALLGDSVLPVGVIPVTSVITMISHGPHRHTEIIYADGTCSPVEVSTLPLYVTEQGNPGNAKGVDFVRIAHPSPLLAGGLVLIDTPGIGSLFTHNTATTRSFLPRIDAALFVLSPDPPITETEARFLDDVHAEVSDILFILNKADLASEEDLQTAVAYLAAVLRKRLAGHEPQIIPVSSLNALQGEMEGVASLLNRSNIDGVKEAIHAFMQRKAPSVLYGRAERRALRLITEMRFALELELKALETPLEDLEARRAQFEAESVGLRSERPTQNYIITGQVRELDFWINDALQEFKTGQQSMTVERLEQWSLRHEAESYRDFRRGLEALAASELSRALDAFRESIEPEIVRRYMLIANVLVADTDARIDRLVQLSGDIFRVALQPMPPLEGLEWKEKLRYVLTEAPLFLEMDVLNALHLFLPPAFLRKKVLQRVRQRAAEYLETNTGGLRASYSYTLQEATRRFQYELENALEDVVTAIGRVVDEVVHRKQALQSSVEQRASGLRKRIQELKDLQQG